MPADLRDGPDVSRMRLGALQVPAIFGKTRAILFRPASAASILGTDGNRRGAGQSGNAHSDGTKLSQHG